jgi:AraC-like DNA-binding protein
MIVRSALIQSFRQPPAACAVDPKLLAPPIGSSLSKTRQRQIPATELVRFCRTVGGRLRRTDYHLQVVDLTPIGGFGAPEFLMRSAATIRTMLETFCRVIRLFCEEHCELYVQRDRAGILFSRSVAPLSASAWMREVLIARLAVLMRDLSEPITLPLQAHFEGEAPPSAAAMARILQAPVRYRRLKTELVLQASALERGIRTSDPSLFQLLDGLCANDLSQLSPPGQLVERARAMIAESLAEQALTLRDIAVRLRTPKRTLLRRLSSNGTSYQQLLDCVRREVAVRAFQTSEPDGRALAAQLGYSAERCMDKAFRRWTGVTSAQYRAESTHNASSRRRRHSATG